MTPSREALFFRLLDEQFVPRCPFFGLTRLEFNVHKRLRTKGRLVAPHVPLSDWHVAGDLTPKPVFLSRAFTANPADFSPNPSSSR